MLSIVLLALVGLLAQLVDGTLGMAYGVTATTALLATGLAPATVSATVHLAEVGTTLASGVAHDRFGNVDRRVVLRLGIPGAVGAFAGATFLSHLSGAAATPFMAVLLLSLGTYLLVRFTLWGLPRHNLGRPLRKRTLLPLGLVAGFVDASGGGGWGPVATPAVMAGGRLEPRRTVGTVDAAEFLVSVAASLGFLVGLGTAGVDLRAATVLLVAGVVAAPVAAWAVRHVPPRILGSAVGGLVVVTNADTLARAADLSGAGRAALTGLLVVVWVGAVLHCVRRARADRRHEESAAVDAEVAWARRVDDANLLR